MAIVESWRGSGSIAGYLLRTSDIYHSSQTDHYLQILFAGREAWMNCELPKHQNRMPIFPVLPLFVEADGSGAAEADNGFDAVLPFDQGVVAMAAVKGTDGSVGLGRHESLTATDGFRVAGAGQG